MSAGPIDLRPRIDAWFAQRGWRPFAFQREVWRAMADGRSGLLHATTGSGKTYAVWLGALAANWREPLLRSGKSIAPPLTVLWLTPMRALAADTLQALQTALDEMELGWKAGLRTGDTSSSERAAQNRRLPTVLVTTPESLSLLLSQAQARETLASVRTVVVDEWHELLGNKRGVQVQLALARLRRWQPELMTWGLSATLGNIDHAMQVLLGPARAAQGRLVQGKSDKDIRIDTLLPATAARFPWAGHLGMQMLPQVVAEIEAFENTLLFVNTRSQAERWYQAMLDARPDWAGRLALHHGSLDKQARSWVEQGLKQGTLKAVVCTASLDLGVDFLPVERVLQIGSPKGVARLLQRAGRSGHAPGRASRVTLVPTHSLELVEAAAARAAAQAGHIEARQSPLQPLDVLVQHLVTVALGGGFTPDDLLGEVRETWAYANLPEAHWLWALDFVTRGGASLRVYPEYRRVLPDEEGVWRVPDVKLGRRHRMGIGTIVSDAGMQVRFWRGRGKGGARLGTVEESFISRLARGDCFLFGGRLLELVRTHEMTAYVRLASGKRAAVPRWNGGRMPLSTELADAVAEQLAGAARRLGRTDATGIAETAVSTPAAATRRARVASAGRDKRPPGSTDEAADSPEMRCVEPLLALQAQWSVIPQPGMLLAESLRSREGSHLFLYPFAGRQVHLAVASLLAWRLAQGQPAMFSLAVNDYGLMLLTPGEFDWDPLLAEALARPGDPADDVLAGLNAAEMARRHFREIARISGLIFQGYPGAQHSTRQLQASSGLFYEVFRQHDPGNMLLAQAEREVLRQELDLPRLQSAWTRMQGQALQRQPLQRPTPFAFPLMVERWREQLSTEKLADRIARLLAELERAADAPPVAPRARSRKAAPAQSADVAPAAPAPAGTEAPPETGPSAPARRPRARPAARPRQR